MASLAASSHPRVTQTKVTGAWHGRLARHPHRVKGARLAMGTLDLRFEDRKTSNCAYCTVSILVTVLAAVKRAATRQPAAIQLPTGTRFDLSVY
jgi:hypothetical protein